MSNFKEASKQGLRIQTSKGLLSVEQLWTLSLTDLDTLAVSLETEYEKSGKKSFLTPKSTADKKLKLAFDIVLEVLNDKSDEATKLSEAKERKEHNNKILELIAKKKDGELEGKSVEELEALLK
jgi:hypothetical protein